MSRKPGAFELDMDLRMPADEPRRRRVSTRLWIAAAGVLVLALGLAVALSLNWFGWRDGLAGALRGGDTNLSTVALEADIAALQAQIGALQSQTEADAAALALMTEANAEQAKEIARLRDFETRQMQYKADKEAFDRLMAEGDAQAFMQFYENYDPVNAEALYKEFARERAQDAEIRDYVATFTVMDAWTAAESLEAMAERDVALVVRILQAMDARQRGLIMNEMTTQMVVDLSRKMAAKLPAAE